MKKLLLLILLLLPATVFAQSPSCTTTPGSTLCNPVGTDNIEQFVQNGFSFIGGLAATVAIIMLVISGAQMMLSSGDQTQITRAKENFKYTVIGFIVSLMSFVVVSAVYNFLGAGKLTADQLDGKPGNRAFSVLGDASFQAFMNRMLNNFLAIIGILALLMIMYNGFKYIVARGDQAATKKAREGIMWSVIGLVITLFAYVIIQAVRNLF